jgi:hypothetical protein
LAKNAYPVVSVQQEYGITRDHIKAILMVISDY